MSISQAVRYVAPTKSAFDALYINCNVKPNARQGSGILSVEDDVVELAVSAQAREGEANNAVIGLLASVSRDILPVWSMSLYGPLEVKKCVCQR